jgi:hypothetical protein
MWEEIAKMVNYIQNRIPTKALKLKTLEEMFSGTKPNLSHLRVIGCVAYCHIPDSKRQKFDPKAIPTLLLGYDEDNKAYRCYNPSTRKILISRDVRFDEQNFDSNVPETTEPLEDSSFLFPPCSPNLDIPAPNPSPPNLPTSLLVNHPDLPIFVPDSPPSSPFQIPPLPAPIPALSLEPTHPPCC